eukprot:4819858-Alexandrium_andersonii.AAC.1
MRTSAPHSRPQTTWSKADAAQHAQEVEHARGEKGHNGQGAGPSSPDTSEGNWRRREGKEALTCKAGGRGER